MWSVSSESAVNSDELSAHLRYLKSRKPRLTGLSGRLSRRPDTHISTMSYCLNLYEKHQ
jgi:hypothetical protein